MRYNQKRIGGSFRRLNSAQQIAVAVVIALLGTAVLSLKQRFWDSPPAISDIKNWVTTGRTEKVAVLMSKAQIQPGSKFTLDNIKVVRRPQNEVPEGAVQRIEDILNMFSTRSIFENNPIFLKDISRIAPKSFADLKGSGSTPIDSAPPGYSSTNALVELVPGMDKWTTPGSRVDVYVQPSAVNNFGGNSGSSSNSSNKKLIAQNAVILSVGNKTESGSGKSYRQKATIVLAVPKGEIASLESGFKDGEVLLSPRDSKMIL